MVCLIGVVIEVAIETPPPQGVLEVLEIVVVGGLYFCWVGIIFLLLPLIVLVEVVLFLRRRRRDERSSKDATAKP